MYVLDTETFSNLPRGNKWLRRHYEGVSAHQIYISAITIEEVLRGILAEINSERAAKSPGPERVESLYRILQDSVRRLARLNILEYTSEDELQFSRWPQSVTRGRTMDCRIAASALRAGFIVVTANIKDFSKIPGTKYQDWSKESIEGNT